MNTQPIPPGYAYFYGQPAMQNLAQAAYGSAAGMYNPAAAAAMSVPSTAATQFQQVGVGRIVVFSETGFSE